MEFSSSLSFLVVGRKWRERDEGVECEACEGRLEGKVALKFCQKSTFNSDSIGFRTTTFSLV